MLHLPLTSKTWVEIHFCHEAKLLLFLNQDATLHQFPDQMSLDQLFIMTLDLVPTCPSEATHMSFSLLTEPQEKNS
jgi:hypothetical protein